MDILNKIGLLCRGARKRDNMTIRCVAYLTGYSISVIGSFENGKNNNERILLWYIKNFNLYDELKEVIDNEKIF